MKKKLLTLIKNGLSSFIMIGLFSVPVFSATITVTNTNNSGAGSFRQAITDATSGDTILFSITGTITLASTITINKNLTIKGPGSSNLIISGNNAVRMFDITAGTVTMAKLAIANGQVASAGADGAAFRITGSTVLTIDRCDVYNHVLSGGNNDGGAIWCEAGTTLYVYRSHLYNNSISMASGEGGSIYTQGSAVLNSVTISGCSGYVGPAIEFRGASGKTMDLINCTISGNNSANDGAIVHQHTGTMNFTNCTVTNNTAANYEAGLFVDDGHVTFRNTVIAGNIASDGGDYIDMDIDTGGLYGSNPATMQSYGYNLIGVESAPTFTWTTGDVRGTKASPQLASLGSLADNGGYKHSHDPNGGSQVINPASSNSAPFVDGKGYLRSSTADKGSCEDGGSLPVATGATGAGTTNFNANWNSVTSATGYLLDVATDSGFTNIVSGYHDLSVGNVVTYAVTGLAASTTYYYRIRATNGNYHSYYTNTITTATLGAATVTQTSTVSPTPTDTVTLTVTSTHTATPTATPTVTITMTDTPTASPTYSPTFTMTGTPSDTPTMTTTITETATPTGTFTSTPTVSVTATASASVTFTSTATLTATESATATVTPSATLTATESATATVSTTITLTATETTTSTATPTVTLTATESVTSTMSPTITLTATESPTSTTTATITQTLTESPTTTITSTTIPTAIDKPVVAFPNPAKNRMCFAVKVTQTEDGLITIYNLSGEKIAVLNETLIPGTCVVEWNCQSVAPGIYIARVKSDSIDEKIKIVIAK